MDKLDKYRKIIRDVLQPYSKDSYAGLPNVKNQLIFDSEHDHYLVVTLGWDGEMPVRDCVFHVDIADKKVWIQEDNTDSDLADLLMEAGIPKSDIVLGFQSPSMRSYSTFGV